MVFICIQARVEAERLRIEKRLNERKAELEKEAQEREATERRLRAMEQKVIRVYHDELCIDCLVNLRVKLTSKNLQLSRKKKRRRKRGSWKKNGEKRKDWLIDFNYLFFADEQERQLHERAMEEFDVHCNYTSLNEAAKAKTKQLEMMMKAYQEAYNRRGELKVKHFHFEWIQFIVCSLYPE
jgi:hypothetical protein